MEILLLVFFIVSEADFHDTNIEFLIDYILQCSEVWLHCQKFVTVDPCNRLFKNILWSDF